MPSGGDKMPTSPTESGDTNAPYSPSPIEINAGDPMNFDERVKPMISCEEIQDRVQALGAELTARYQGKDLVIIGILNGTLLFMADLIRCMPMDLTLDFVGVSSYGSGMESGKLNWTKPLTSSLASRHVLVVEDILETGQTLNAVVNEVMTHNPATLSVCVLLSKNVPRKFTVQADYTGFQIEDEFVVGYGLDLDGQYRNLPFIGIFTPPDGHDVGGKSPERQQDRLIRIHLQFWSHFKDLTGADKAEFEIPEGSTIAELAAMVYSTWSQLSEHRHSALIAIGNNYAQGSYQLKDGDTVSFFPPVQGG